MRSRLPALSALVLTVALGYSGAVQDGIPGSQDRRDAVSGAGLCGVRDPDARTARIVAREDRRFRLRERAREARAPGRASIQVYFHVLNAGAGYDNGDVPDEVLRQQLQVMNDSFAGRTGGAATRFQFVLAGITRTTDAAWFTLQPGAERRMKAALRTGGVMTLNYYLCRPSGPWIGWSAMPWNYRPNPVNDGVLTDYRTLPGGTHPRKNEGDIGVHETGHWLGLYHTFMGGCSRANDSVADTPAERDPATGVLEPRDTCTGRLFPGLDPIENFMDYSPDSVMHQFTPGQAARMSSMARQYRGL